MDAPYTFIADLGTEAQSPKRGIHSQTLVRHEAFELVLFAMAAGEQLSEHTSAHPAGSERTRSGDLDAAP